MGNLTAANVWAGSAVIDTNGLDVTVSQALTHEPSLADVPDGELRKLGSGSLGLMAANTCTGGTSILAGTLVADHDPARGTGTASLASDTTLAIAAGRDVGGIGGLSAGDGSTLRFEGARSRFSLSSGVFLLGDATIDLNHAFDAVGIYVLIDGVNGGNVPTASTLADVDLTRYRYDFAIVDGDAILSVTPASAVPEPTTSADLTLAANSLRRRRRRVG